jgi:hypothetical protein
MTGNGKRFERIQGLSELNLLTPMTGKLIHRITVSNGMDENTNPVFNGLQAANLRIDQTEERERDLGVERRLG